MIWKILRSLLFLLDPEKAHRLTVALLRKTPRPLLRAIAQPPGTAAPAEVWGLEFRNRVGLAAGFDKDAELLAALPALGFGFAEIGTVTPRAQPGNPKPRLFRQPEAKTLFNRMGFNNEGAEAAAHRLEAARPKLPPNFRVGVNLGKNKDTELQNAARDYAEATRPFRGLADYLVINLSSPNTLGLRSLQNEADLKKIIGAVQAEMGAWPKLPPLLLKLAPELRGEELGQLLRSAESAGVDGFVLTNTWGGTLPYKGENLSGGFSGLCLEEPSRQALQAARAATKKPIISVGGILSVEEARARIRLGADLVQIYTGWVLRGPGFPSEIARSLEN